MDELGVIHGRFQMLHIGHMEYLLAGRKRCRHLIVGITNPDISCLAESCAANPHRATASGNPLSFEERRDMVTGALIEAGVPEGGFEVVPFPIDEVEALAGTGNSGACGEFSAARDKLFAITPREAKYYMTIYDEWSLEKLTLLKRLGCDVEVMWTRTNDEKVTSGTEVRARIAAGKPWRELVPPFVYRYITEHGIDKRIIQCAERTSGQYSARN